MRISVRINPTKDSKYRAACHSLPGCVITADSYEDAVMRIQRAVEGYMASLNVAHPIRLEIHRNTQRSEVAVSTLREEIRHEARRDTATLQGPGMRHDNQPFYCRG